MDEWGSMRKSPTTESHETKIRLLNLMITGLKKRCFCEKIFASFSSVSNSPIIQRDYDTNDIELELIDSGLSNDPDDVYNTLKLYKSVKEIVIDHGYKIEVIDSMFSMLNTIYELGILEYNLFVSDPNLFVSDPNLFVSDPNLFVSDPNLFVSDPDLI
ncbi:uncharacterized protein BX663DRAFT_554742 [Cokeromyces recurvatus]|uniref:uncharacterized protein n=1 Tax=Cokeromyces recurvatus TaxID=90255 RepID=UPI00221F51D5|nr:uncharacterized protein BX663DRAFT_554742 [Cokeromyces recurvatus]KAI7899790.1 hypothetical protein BX663DRAFT_554742 [Cokeromyces recurvatus]